MEQLQHSGSQQPYRPNHQADVVPSLPVDVRRRVKLRRVEAARTAKYDFSTVDGSALAAELRERVRGEVRFDDASRALYATDGSNYRQTPIGVVLPRDIDDVVATIAAARRHGAPVLARGGGTSLAGQCCNVAVVMDFSKYMHGLVELDAEKRRARVQPGLVLDDLRDAAEKFHLTFGPDPSTHNHCTLGGMIGNNSCGVHSVMAGKTDDNVEELEILTYGGLRLRVGKTDEAGLSDIIRAGGRRGEIYARLKALRDRYADLMRRKFPDIPRRVSGYNLPWLLPENGFHVARALVGSECTCVTVLEATVRLVPSPPVRSLVVLGYPDVYSAGDHIMEVLASKPIALEGLDDNLVHDMRKKKLHPQDIDLLPEGKGWLLVEFGGENKAEADERARDLIQKLKKKSDAPSVKFFDNPAEERTIWLVRRSGLGATARVPGEKDTWEGWEDSAAPPEKLGNYLRDLRKLLTKYGYACALYGHFGQGCVHTRIDFDLVSKAGIEKYRTFIHEAADLVLGYGGSLSGEHGDGQSRGELLPKMFGPELMQAFREFKSIWDPDWKMNPGKVIDAYRMDENLRLGANYRPPDVATHFKFPGDDEGSFARATLRCVGVGECRRESVGTMCPSYRATREEMHSTRGRARLLFEMLRGDPLGDGWRDRGVREALDLCLACKGCKGECPVQVDMATYKAEFLSHYYEKRLRPRHAYSMGLIYWWARLASLAPRAVNFFTHAPLAGRVLKFIGGIAPERDVPAFAPETFTRWFRRRAPRNIGHAKVMLWPDTFNNHFYPEICRAAVEVLEAAGFRVVIPQVSLCCGRPLYDFGMLDTAKRLLRRILDTLTPEIEAGVPIVGLEPSCMAVFRDEMLNLFPHDEDAKRLAANCFLLPEFLETMIDGYQPPQLGRKALVHGHCHQKAIMGMAHEKNLFAKLGLDCELLDSGCCGMAGSFGFEAGHYDVSMKIGEQSLLPAVRRAPADALVVADGFSCREQVRHATGRKPLHSAQLLQMAVGQTVGRPIERVVAANGHNGRRMRAALVVGATAVASAWMLARKGHNHEIQSARRGE
ncbi:MAG TPA: FAD-linked oxidase C-terminal domain-containing protein [Candidatus Binatia bacterium]|jgi:FAD/FMN-containing dehydrogenase/Fe-S oxidoreductase